MPQNLKTKNVLQDDLTLAPESGFVLLSQIIKKFEKILIHQVKKL